MLKSIFASERLASTTTSAEEIIPPTIKTIAAMSDGQWF